MSRLNTPASRYYADATRRTAARAYGYALRTYAPQPFGAPWKRENRNDYADGTRYCDNVSEYFRETGEAERITSLRHTGWYVDNDASETTRGIVLQLPARKGVPQYVAAYTDPNNDNCASVKLTKTFATADEAARYADQLAERYAELCRDDDAQQRAEMDIESAKDEIALARSEHTQLAREMRLAQRVQFDLLDPSYIPPARLTDRAPSAICKALRAQLQAIRGQVSDAIKTIKARREDYWTAVHN